MREATKRAKELIKSGVDVEEVVEQLIQEGYFPKAMRNDLVPVVEELDMMINRKGPYANA